MIGNTLLICGFLTVFWAPWAGIPLLIISYFVINAENAKIKRKENTDKDRDKQYWDYVHSRHEKPTDRKTIEAARLVNRHGITDELKSFIREDPSEYVAFPINHKEWLKSELDQFENSYKKEGKDYLDYGDNRLFVSPEKYQKICNYVDSWIDQKLIDDWTGETERKEQQKREQEQRERDQKERENSERRREKREREKLEHIEVAKSQCPFYELDFVETDIFNGLHETFYENGQTKECGNLVDGKKDGEWNIFYEEGQLMERGTYKNGMPTDKGVYALYQSGKFWKHTYFFEGLKNYKTTELWENGNRKLVFGYDTTVSKMFDVDPLIDTDLMGPHIEIREYDEEDRPKREETYDGDGLAERKTYWPKGKLKKVEKYSSGLKHGDWEEYDRDGNRLYFETWMHGELYKSYNEEGEEIEPNMSSKDSLKKALQDLKELYDDNLISEEIYKERQKELLKKIGD